MKLIELKEWLSIHVKILKKDKMAAYMQCIFHKLKYDNEVILCNIDSIPNGYSIQDVIDIVGGKHIKL